MTAIKRVLPFLVFIFMMAYFQYLDHEQDKVLQALHERLLNLDVDQVQKASYRIGGTFLEDETFLKGGDIDKKALSVMLKELKKDWHISHVTSVRGCSVKLELPDNQNIFLEISVSDDTEFSVVMPYSITSEGYVYSPSRSEGQYYFMVQKRVIDFLFGHGNVRLMLSNCHMGDLRPDRDEI